MPPMAMTHAERFFAVVAGRDIDRPAFFPDISDWYAAARTPSGEPRSTGAGRFIPDDDPLHASPGSIPPRFAGWTYLDFYRNFDWGLPVHIYDWFDEAYDGVEKAVARDGNRRITRFRSPAGELEKVDAMASDGSWAPIVHFVKDLADLRTMRYVVERTRFVPRFDRVRAVVAALGDMGVADLAIMRSPFGKLVHEYMGFDRVVYALHDEPAVIADFMAVQEIRDLQLTALAAEAPARVAILSDHADENLISPDMYRRFCIPYYRKAAAALHAGGKIVSTHLDGNFKSYLPFIGQTHFDLLDGCTPAPMMNYQVEELADALPPEMACYCGVPATLLCQDLPDAEVVAFGRRILDAFSARTPPTCRPRVILNVGDILPPNGRIEQVVQLADMARNYQPPTR